MVQGLDIFAKHFKSYIDQYLLIGGSACDLLFDQQGLIFRKTKDLDIILIAETIDRDFVECIWQFINEADYRIRERHESKIFYRFDAPQNGEKPYPKQLEFFSRIPDAFQDRTLDRITPISVDMDIVSLSAIILDDEYYALLTDHKLVIEGIPVASPLTIAALKARAYLDMKEREANGESVKTGDIAKHRNDVFRMLQVMNPSMKLDAGHRIKDDISSFLAEMASPDVVIESLAEMNMSKEQAIQRLQTAFELEESD